MNTEIFMIKAAALWHNPTVSVQIFSVSEYDQQQRIIPVFGKLQGVVYCQNESGVVEMCQSLTPASNQAAHWGRGDQSISQDSGRSNYETIAK